ncbi:hypothetical protein [Pseudomonas rhodesiae]|uniref:hypothetical protein n=1 Tax=Pseudomonas rhodesiae TaxID=76760 RepID=UPI0032B20ECF
MIDLSGLLEKVSKVNLKGGVVGKVCTTLMFVSACLAVVGYSSGEENIKLGSLVLIGVITSVFLWKIIGFADRHPQAALLEGSEFIVHERLKMGSKDNPVIDVDPMDRKISTPIENESVVAQLSRVPDDEVAVTLQHDGKVK